jgi:hypothetical protein
LYDSGSHHTHFTGFMLEEEIVANFWGFVLNIQNAQNERQPEHFSLEFFLVINGEWFLTSFDSNSLTGGNFFAKILLCTQIIDF